jgi:hypothetical protein
LDVSSSGQVWVVVDPVAPGIRKSQAKTGREGREGRKDYLVLMEFEMGYEAVAVEGLYKVRAGYDRRMLQRNADNWQVLFPLPKCLDNVIRFQIHSPRASSSTSSGEVNILTEPKMLALPPSTFLPPVVPKRRRTSRGAYKAVKSSLAMGREEGWEDGEDLGPDDYESSSEEEVEESDEVEGGSWLEGRFQR